MHLIPKVLFNFSSILIFNHNFHSNILLKFILKSISPICYASVFNMLLVNILITLTLPYDDFQTNVNV
jgi:hypothetical protein